MVHQEVIRTQKQAFDELNVLIVQMEDVYMKAPFHIAEHKLGIPPVRNVDSDIRVPTEPIATTVAIPATDQDILIKPNNMQSIQKNQIN